VSRGHLPCFLFRKSRSHTSAPNPSVLTEDFSCFFSVGRLKDRKPLGRSTHGRKDKNETDEEGMVCSDLTVLAGIGCSVRIFRHGNDFSISIREGKIIYHLNKYYSQSILCF
jgi:hypothetical protein